MGFVVAALSFLQLLFEAPTLVFGIVQFAEAVGNFHLSSKDFPALGPIRLVSLLLGQGRNSSGKLVNNGRLNQVLFSRSLEQGGDSLSRRLIWIVSDMSMRRIKALHQYFYPLGRREFRDLGLCTGGLRPILNDGFAHGHPPPVRPGPINLVLTPLGSRPTGYIFC